MEPILLWPGGAPGAAGAEDVDVPTLTPSLPPADRATGAAVVVCPGGGYVTLAPHEARPIAEWLNTLGIAAFVLKYRLAPRYRHPAMLQDASRAIRTVRARAGEWGVDPGRVGILGFSAGGHLASTAGTLFDPGDPGAPDPIERASSRPDLMVLVYAVTSVEQFTRTGSRLNLIGADAPEELVKLLSTDQQVTPETPPAFLLHTVADTVVPYENSILFARALAEAGVPHELHVFERGPHGFGLGGNDPVLSQWPRLCAAWLQPRGFAMR